MTEGQKGFSSSDFSKERRTERQKDRKTKGQKDRRTERQKDRKTKGQKDRRTERQKDKRQKDRRVFQVQF